MEEQPTPRAGDTAPMPQVGGTAPAIEAATADGGRFSLGEHRGRWVVLYFYPRANTPG